MNPASLPLLSLAPNVRALVDALAHAGGRALLVGGSVRDALLQQPPGDLDFEVHGLALAALRTVLKRFGRVNEVGRSFGVFKLRIDAQELDVSVPRRDSKVGPGHRGIQAEADPDLGVVEAARRRDLTINAIAWDPRTNELVDPFGGARDLDARLLRAVDAATFAEDPLRALRVAQFAARFEFDPAPELEALCRGMALGELPAERVRGEVEKLLLKGKRPSIGWNFAYRAQLWARVVPEWDHPCPPDLDALAALSLEGAPRRLALLLAAATEPAHVVALLDRLQVFRQDGYDVRGQVLALLAAQNAPFPNEDLPTRARRLAETVEVELLAALTNDAPLRAAADALGAARTPLVPLLSGRDLLALGMEPGPELGRVLAAVREEQLAGRLSSPDPALAWARSRIR